MKVTRWQIVVRGVTHRCPNCGGRTLFRPGTLFQVNVACTRCGLPIERDEGFFLGAMTLNYGFTFTCWLLPILLLYYHHRIGTKAALVSAGAGAVAIPVLFYRSSRSWWLMNYYFFLPQHLPANQTAESDGADDENT